MSDTTDKFEKWYVDKFGVSPGYYEQKIDSGSNESHYRWQGFQAAIAHAMPKSEDNLPQGLIADMLVAADFVRNRHQSKEVADRLVNYAHIMNGFDKPIHDTNPQPSTDISELEAEHAKLINAVERSNKALIVLRTVLDVAGLNEGVATAYEMHEDNNKLLCTIRDRQAHREMI